MNWYYSIRGAYTHVRVFLNGAKCGDLVFHNEEFNKIKEFFTERPGLIKFLDENVPETL